MKGILSLFVLCISLSVWASEDSVYEFNWLDQDKEVYVLQNRKFRKKSNVYIGGTIGRSINGAFIDSNEISLQAGYFFSENWGLELSYTKASGSTNKTHDSVEDQGAGNVAYFRKIDTATSALLMWSPFYAKINTFNKIFYFDWMFGAGLSQVSTLDNRNKFEGIASVNFDDLTAESVMGFTWTTTARFYINKNWSTRMDFKALHLNSDTAVSQTESEKRWSHYYNFNLGLTYAF